MPDNQDPLAKIAKEIGCIGPVLLSATVALWMIVLLLMVIADRIPRK